MNHEPWYKVVAVIFDTIIPWFINSAMYPIKIKKCFGVAKRFLRSETAPVFRGVDIFVADENDYFLFDEKAWGEFRSL